MEYYWNIVECFFSFGCLGSQRRLCLSILCGSVSFAIFFWRHRTHGTAGTQVRNSSKMSGSYHERLVADIVQLS